MWRIQARGVALNDSSSEINDGDMRGSRANKKESPTARPSGFLGIKPGSVLLSHGNPHTIIGAEQFHFRVREGIGWFPLAMAARQFSREAALRHASQIKIQVVKFCKALVCCLTLDHTRLLGCYMVKPHGQLVWVSSTPCSAYTPHLSTS
jgi:hypothetical protein